jgi:hypothetical protein
VYGVTALTDPPGACSCGGAVLGVRGVCGLCVPSCAPAPASVPLLRRVSQVGAGCSTGKRGLAGAWSARSACVTNRPPPLLIC